ncbi:MAG: hypothetical protein QM736_24520 [Vicinamibacterales bacterium]
MPFAQVAENVPAIEFDVWLVTCHENPVHELAEMFESGFDVQVPSIDGVVLVGVGVVGVGVCVGVGVDDDEVLVLLGASTFVDERSKPVQAVVTSEPAASATRRRRFMTRSCRASERQTPAV